MRWAPKGRHLKVLVAWFLGALVALTPAAALAGEERYDYDGLGRLIRVIDEQGRVTEYVYDAAGNLLRVITGGNAQAPSVTSSSPASIRRGETKAVQIIGTGLTGAHVSTPDAELDVSSLRATATQIDFNLTPSAAATLGARTITVSNSAGSTSISITVNPVLPKLSMSPQPIAVPPTNTARSFFVSLSSPDNIPHTIGLASANTAIATVSPASIVIPAGQIEVIVAVTGKAAGTTAINVTSPDLPGTSVPVFVTAEFSGITTSFAPPVRVDVLQAAGQSSTSFGPFASSLVGVAKGAYVIGIAPATLRVGNGPTSLVVSGVGLAGVTGATITPPDGLIAGALSVAPDGRSVSVPVMVASDAPTTIRTLKLVGPNQPYLAARPGADQFLITLPPPQIESIDPIFATAGTTAMTLTVRGRNLQATQSVALTPPGGISVSSTPAASADGTSLTVAISVSSLAETGARVVTVTTAGGTSEPTANSANTFSVVNEVEAVYTPIASAHVGVVKENAAAPTAGTLSAFATHIGVVVPPAAFAISPSVGIVGQTLDLIINGVGLGGVTSVQMSPADGVTLGAPSIGAGGTSLTIPISIAPSAPQTLRMVRLIAGSAPVLFTDANAALFRVSAPLAEFDSMSPIVLQVGAPSVTVTIAGRNLQNASQVRLEPAAGITVSSLTVNGTGSQASFTVSAAAGAATGPRAVILTTPAGDSTATLNASNTLTLVNSIQGSVTPVTAAALGVVVETTTPQATQSVGPFVSPALGVLVETAPPAAPQDTARARQIGVAVGSFATGVQVPPLTPNSAGTLTISGVRLSDVTAVQIEPAVNITVGALTFAPDGTQISAPLTLSSAAPGLRGVRLLRGTQRVEFLPTGTNTFRIGVGVPSIDSIAPILNSRGQIFSMVLRGQNFQDATAVTAAPGTGVFIDEVLSVNAAGTEVTVRISIAADAPLGSHVLRVVTPGGATTDAAIPANTFTVLE